MRLKLKPAWAYALLLLLLFSTAAVSVSFVMSEIRELLSHRSDYPLVAGVFWLLSMGFMFIVGAFGLWTIRLAEKSEARRSVAEVLHSLDFTRDALFTLDNRGDVTGRNPALERYAASFSATRCSLAEMFPSLLPDCRARIINSSKGNDVAEVEADCIGPDAIERTLRFRSIGTGQLRLIQVSDVTLVLRDRKRRRQAARLNLFSQVARGLANDFNAILCAISGHAALLQRLTPGSEQAAASIDTILRSAERGESLTEGFRSLVVEQSSDMRCCAQPMRHIILAVDELQGMLATAWRVNIVRRNEDELPPSPLTSTQIEQIVINLGLIIAERRPAPGFVSLVVEDGEVLHASAVLLLLWTKDGHPETSVPLVKVDSEIEGLIPSVVNDFLVDVGGMLESLRDPHGHTVFRVTLPLVPSAATARQDGADAGSLSAVVDGWSVLYLAPESSDAERHVAGLRKSGCSVLFIHALAPLLERMEKGEPLDCMLLHESILGNDAAQWINAFLKLCPSTPLVCLSSEKALPGNEPSVLVAIVSPVATVDTLLRVMGSFRQSVPDQA